MNVVIRLREFLVRSYIISFLVLWTILIASSIASNLYQNHNDTIAKARIEARTIYRHNIAYRKWSTMHGGIYSRISNENKKSPHLFLDLKDMDKGIAFAMIDPFQMTRQAYEVLHKQNPSLAAISHTVSLDFQKTQDPYDQPDLWEKEVLKKFNSDLSNEESVIATINNAPYLRLIKPHVIDQGCIKCHTGNDYKIGNVSGGMSVAIPLQPYYATEVKAKRTIFLTHLLLWLLGCIFIAVFSNAFKRYRATSLESEQKFRIVSEFAHNFEYWIKQDNTLAFISPSCERLTGYSRDEFMDKPRLLIDIIHPDDKNPYRKHVDKIDAPAHEGIDFKIIKKDGEIRWFTHTCSPITINDEFLGRRGSSIDITEHKILEERLLRANQLECLGQFAGGIAHDFNNVLSSINTFTHLLTDEIKHNKHATDYVKYIKIAAKLGKNLTSNLLSFGKKQIVKPQRTSLKNIVTNISDILRTLVDEDIHYVFDLSDIDLEISVDPHQIEQILINLCTNARDAMKSGGTISISTKAVDIDETRKGAIEEIPAGNYMALTVSDTGNGIEPKYLKQIIEPFFTTKSSSKGTGLGLAIIYTIVKQHNSFLDVKSILNKGTTFTIFIPGHTPYQQTISPSLESSGLEPASPGNSSGDTGHKKPGENSEITPSDITILLADDDELIRKSLSIPLERTGYKIITAEDGKKAISLFLDNKEDISLAILDVVMPHRNGKEVFDIIRKNNKNIQVIFISGYTDNIISDDLLKQEGVHFFPKPIDIESFLEAVNNLLENKNEA